MIFQRIKVTWIRENAPSNLPKIKDLRGGWINGKFDVRMAGIYLGYDNFVWDKVKNLKINLFHWQNSDSVYKQLPLNLSLDL